MLHYESESWLNQILQNMSLYMIKVCSQLFMFVMRELFISVLRWIRMGVSGWMFLLVPAYPGCPGQTAIKWLLLLLS